MESDHPFAGMPGLEGFHLSGARVAVTRGRSYRAPSDLARQLWFNARGFNETEGWKKVKASKIITAYTSHQDAAIFSAQERHPVFPLSPAAVRRDDILASRQARIGAAAHALCLAMSKINESVELLTGDAVTPTPETSGRAQQLLTQDVGTSLGHVLRTLAAESSAVCRERRQICLLQKVWTGRLWKRANRPRPPFLEVTCQWSL